MEISLVWWNTSLSPPKAKKDRVSDNDKKIALGLVLEFIDKHNIDVLGLCEVAQADIDWLGPHISALGYLIESAVTKAGRGAFDSCVIYRADKLAFKDKSALEYRKLRRTTRVGYQLLFEIIEESRPFHVFVSHWPSRLNLEANAPLRHTLGTQLRNAVETILNADPKSLIVLMGDYNDEPFDASLALNLFASRDRALVRANSELLYNPFWRRLGGRDHYQHDNEDTNYAGTYFHKGASSDRWHTFDQIIVSSAFLGNSDWHLKEASVEIVDIPEYTKYVLDSKMIFDHLPVKVVLERIA